MAKLEVQNISKAFNGVHAVESVSISFEQGKITSIIGPNGSGKTTLTNLITGLLPFDKGHVVVAGKLYARVSPSQAESLGITRTFQEARLIEQVSVLENVVVIVTNRGVANAFLNKASKEELDAVEQVLKKVNLWEKRNDLAGKLSYGQRKLLEIARVLLMVQFGGAHILIFDEPFAGLFKEIIKLIVDIIKELKEQGKTIILIEHNMDLIRELSDHIVVMDSGKVLAEGKPEEVLNKREVIEAYLGE